MYYIVRLLLIITIGYILYKVLWKGEPLFRTKPKRGKPHPQTPLEEMKKDPICGTYIPENQAIRYRSAGETHYFCSEECQRKFRQLQRK